MEIFERPARVFVESEGGLVFAVNADEISDESFVRREIYFRESEIENVPARPRVERSFGGIIKCSVGATVGLAKMLIDRTKATENVLPLGKERVVEIKDNDAIRHEFGGAGAKIAAS